MAETEEYVELIPRPNTARAMLDLIDEFYCRGGEEAENLQVVLSAQRGPDNDENLQIKRETTGPIRCAAFPKMMKKAQRGDEWELNMSFQQSRSGTVIIRSSTWRAAGQHFMNHARDAAKRLGLIVQNVNDDDERYGDNSQ